MWTGSFHLGGVIAKLADNLSSTREGLQLWVATISAVPKGANTSTDASSLN